MKQFLAILACGAILAPSTLGSQEPEDVFNQSLREARQSVTESWAKFKYESDKLINHAKARKIDQADLDAYRAAESEFEETRRRLKPSKLDMWEARQRLIEYIYDSDDETVFSLYMTAMDSERGYKEALEEANRIRAQIERNRQNRAAQGVSLTPEN